MMHTSVPYFYFFINTHTYIYMHIIYINIFEVSGFVAIVKQT